MSFKSKKRFLFGLMICSFLCVFIVIMLSMGGLGKKPLVLKTGSAEAMYSGTLLACEEYEIEGLEKDRYAVVTFSESRKDAGLSINYATVSIFDDEDRDVTNEYRITNEFGTLKILPRELCIQSMSAEKTFDGTPLTNHEYVIVSGQIVEGDDLRIDFKGTQTSIGYCDNYFRVDIVDRASKITVKNNYKITYIYGKLTVSS